MDWLHDLVFFDGKFLGITWSVWKVVGWLGNAVFAARFFVQWRATEKKKQVVVPVAFWWLSLVGSLLLFLYALVGKRDSVFIFAYAFTWIPYVRNLVIHHRHLDEHVACANCGTDCPPSANFCAHCGANVKRG
ncbi:MAG: lipid A biosynthesis acyltransferase [Verrucomicrobia bacterium]|nr:lipid A biosynthesis acyltransferase [Verrucomicrobiota bacterium]